MVPFGPRTIQGYVMNIQQEPDGNMDISKLKEIKEVRDIKPELTSELIQLSEWMSHYHVMKRISVLEAMLPSAIKAKYKKAFQYRSKIYLQKPKRYLTMTVITYIKKLSKTMI